MEEARKLTFQEVWESATIFFVDETLENEIDETVRELLETTERLPHREERTLLTDPPKHQKARLPGKESP